MRPLNPGSSRLVPQLRKIRVERLSSDSLGSFAGNRCTPRGEGGGQGERERTNRGRAPQKFEHAAAQLHSVASVTHRRRGLARSGMDWQATTIANPRSQDNSSEATPCSAVSRILMGRGFRVQKGRERVPLWRSPAARAIRVTKEEWPVARSLHLAPRIAPVSSFRG